MLLKDIKIELKDNDSRFILKRAKTSENDFLNRKMPVINPIYQCEKNRERYGKTMFDSPIQVHNLRWDTVKKKWDYTSLEEAKEHAIKYNRIFLARKQMNWEQWQELTLSKSYYNFEDMLNRGMNNLTLEIPITANLEEFKKLKEDANSVLNKSQRLMPILSTRHNPENFSQIMEHEFERSKFIGLNGYSINREIEPYALVNLSKFRSLNFNLNMDGNIPLNFIFNYPRVLIKHSNIAGSFAYSCFGGDVFVEKTTFLEGMPDRVIKEMMNKSPDEFYYYDVRQKSFNKSYNQEKYYNINLTKQFMQTVNVAEGLTAYETLRWKAHQQQQDDFLYINNLIMQNKILMQEILDHSGWNIFWDRVVKAS